MKKKIIFGIAVIVCIVVMCLKNDAPDYRIYQSFVMSGPGRRDVILNVIVDKEPDNLEELFSEIKEFHENMNGDSSELEIKLLDAEHQEIAAKKYVNENYVDVEDQKLLEEFKRSHQRK